MFYIHGIHGRVFSGTLEQLRQQRQLVTGVAHARRIAPVAADGRPPTAALLLHTGLPGVPVAGDTGVVLGFVSRTDLLRALTTAPPLDLWG